MWLTWVCVVNYLPGTGWDLCESTKPPKGVASVHVIQRLRAVPQQAEAHRVLVVVRVAAAPQLVLNNPGRRYETETADGDQSGGEEHPEAAHTAEHRGSLGQEAQRQTDPKPGFFFFLLPSQERMHLELTPSKSGLQLQPLTVQSLDIRSIWASRASGLENTTREETHISRGNDGDTLKSSRPSVHSSWKNVHMWVTQDVCHTQNWLRTCHVSAGGGAVSFRNTNVSMCRCFPSLPHSPCL